MACTGPTAGKNSALRSRGGELLVFGRRGYRVGPVQRFTTTLAPTPGADQSDCQPSHSCGRFLEIRNIVFMAFNRHEDGTPDAIAGAEYRHRSGPGANNLRYPTHRILVLPATTRPIFCSRSYNTPPELGGHSYGASEAVDLPCRILADHARAVTFLLADGVLPANDGRGYVLRRIIRRAVYFGRRWASPEDSGWCAWCMQSSNEWRARIRTCWNNDRRWSPLAGQEERRFHETLERGIQRLEEILAHLETTEGVFPGAEAFRLYDTFGLPKEVTRRDCRSARAANRRCGLRSSDGAPA